MDTGSFVIYVKTKDLYKDIANDVGEWFDTSNYDNSRPFPVGKNKKVVRLFKNELGGNNMTEFVGFRAKTYAYLMDNDTAHKKAKETKKCIIKRELLFKNFKDCLFNYKIILKPQQRFKSNCHNVYPEQINKVVLSTSDDKRLRIFDKITTNP